MPIVMDVDNPDKVQSYSCTPREAVMAAHAQSMRDWNTWDYERKYAELVRETDNGFICGQFWAKKGDE